MSKGRWNRRERGERVRTDRLTLVSPTSGAGRLEGPFAGDPLMVSSVSRAKTAQAVAARVHGLIETVHEGRILDAVEEFYAPDVELGRGALAPMFGLEACAGRHWLRRNLDAEWRSFRVRGTGVNGDTSFIECALEFVAASGERFAQDQVAVAQWCDGRIVKECLLPTR
ncbi:MAG: hypothetical protein GY944_26295 [bacterium]|nr:hypothetical protein [bacterium]